MNREALEQLLFLCYRQPGSVRSKRTARAAAAESREATVETVDAVDATQEKRETPPAIYITFPDRQEKKEKSVHAAHLHSHPPPQSRRPSSLQHIFVCTTV